MKLPLFIAEHARRPHGVLGLIVAEIMSRETLEENLAAIDMLGVREDESIVDIGTGHGRALSEICSRAPRVQVSGIDDSKKMLAIAARKNAHLIEENRVTLINTSSDSTPIPDASFDAAITMNTIYFWSNPVEHFCEIARILKPSGRFVIGFHPAGDFAVTSKFPSEIYTFRSEDEVASMLGICGFEMVDWKTMSKRAATMVLYKAQKR